MARKSSGKLDAAALALIEKIMSLAPKGEHGEPEPVLAKVRRLLEIVLTPGWTCKAICTHWGGHPDERVAIWMLRKLAEALFPGKGIATAPIKYYDTGRFTPDGRPAVEWEKEGYLAPGIWYSSLDEHDLEKDIKKGQCSATMTALFLGKRTSEHLAQILELTLSNDRGGGAKTWDLPTTLREMFNAGASEEVMQHFTETLLNAKYNAQVHFFRAEDDIARNPPKMVHVTGKDGFGYHAILVQSDNPSMHSALNLSKMLVCDQCPPAPKAEDGQPKTRFYRPHIVVQYRSTGHVTIFAKRGIKISRVIEGWRRREARALGLPNKFSIEELRADGTHPRIPTIHFQEEADRAMNGGLRTKTVPATKVKPEDIFELCLHQLAARMRAPREPERRKDKRITKKALREVAEMPVSA